MGNSIAYWVECKLCFLQNAFKANYNKSSVQINSKRPRCSLSCFHGGEIQYFSVPTKGRVIQFSNLHSDEPTVQTIVKETIAMENATKPNPWKTIALINSYVYKMNDPKETMENTHYST